MTEKELVTLPKGSVPDTARDDVFKKTTQSGDYLPRLQLMTSNSEMVKDDKFPMNHYALVRDQNYADLGKEVDVLLIEWRPKAIEIDEQILAVYDPDDAEFVRIQAESAKKDTGCMYGPEFLIWVPKAEEFATFFMGSKSSRREATSVRALLKKAGTLKSKKISTSQYTWYSPVIEKCASVFDVPGKDAILEQWEKFTNPPKSEVEKAPDKEDKDKRAR